MFKKYVSESIHRTKTSLKKTQEFNRIHKRMMMLLQEYQAQKLLKKYSVPTPKVNNF